MKVVRFLVVSLAILVISAPLSAETHYACAAIYPCDEDGNLMKEYMNPEDACFEYYLNQCLNTKVRMLSEEVKYCEFERKQTQGIESENEKLKKKLRKVRARLKKRGRK